MADLGDIGYLISVNVIGNGNETTLPGYNIIPQIYIAELNIALRYLEVPLGSISSVVTINSVPAKALVLLLNESFNIIDSTYSDDVTGEFSFDKVPTTSQYSIIVRDINKQYADEIRSFKIPI